MCRVPANAGECLLHSAYNLAPEGRVPQARLERGGHRCRAVCRELRAVKVPVVQELLILKTIVLHLLVAQVGLASL
ncbi:hypothetical protein AA103581_0447 [Gluconobacter wancherniae NBRC 103581]|nr:hypothetical protein AA103581_0447 [Gluconobacter wancherniae NBRC 103581]